MQCGSKEHFGCFPGFQRGDMGILSRFRGFGGVSRSPMRLHGELHKVLKALQKNFNAFQGRTRKFQ